MEMEIGYIVEYSKKPGFFEPYTERQRRLQQSHRLQTFYRMEPYMLSGLLRG